MNYFRAHETPDHIAMKRAVAAALGRLGFLFILFEHWCCDLVAVRPGIPVPFVLGVEIERSFRNVEANIARDLANGCSQVLVACIDITLRDHVAACLSDDLRRRVAVKTVREILAGDTTWMQS